MVVTQERGTFKKKFTHPEAQAWYREWYYRTHPLSDEEIPLEELSYGSSSSSSVSSSLVSSSLGSSSGDDLPEVILFRGNQSKLLRRRSNLRSSSDDEKGAQDEVELDSHSDDPLGLNNVHY